MRDVPLANVIQSVLIRIPVSSGATYVLKGDVVEITTPRQAMTEGWEAIFSRDYSLWKEFPYRARCVDGPDFPPVGLKATCLTAEFVYWHRVMAENAKILQAEVTSSRHADP
jgi:hypothetical protein